MGIEQERRQPCAQRMERLHRLVDLAADYNDWTRKELADALDRDRGKIYPSDNPKLDFVVKLAEALDWSIGDMAEVIWDGIPSVAAAGQAVDFESLDVQVKAAHRNGEYARTVSLARELAKVAATPDQRAIACNREGTGWDGLGRFPKALHCYRRGLQYRKVTGGISRMLEVNLANAYYTLWELTPAMGTAGVILQRYKENPPQPEDRLSRGNQAFAYYVRGNCLRRLAMTEEENMEHHSRVARDELETAVRLWTGMAEDFKDQALGGIANTCRGGIIEVDVNLGNLDGQTAVDQLWQGVKTEDLPIGDWLESYGWWCVFGSNIALRCLTGRKLQETVARFTNKAFEIAERLDNWSLRERAFTLDFSLHQALVGSTDLDFPLVIDQEDKRLITGTMARFPLFRDVAWRILETAKVISNN